MVFDTRTAAAGRLRRLTAPRLGGIETYGILIDDLIMSGVDAADNLIVEHTLVVVHVACIVGTVAVQVLREFGKVVGTARLVEGRFGALVTSPSADVGVHRQHLRIGLTEHLAVAYTTHGIAVATLNHRPKVLGQVVVIGVAVATERTQGACDHGDVLVGMTRADGIDIACQGVEECRRVEVVRGLEQMGPLRGVVRHLGQTCQALGHATHLTGDVHVPHLVAVARLGTTFLLRAVALHVGAVVQTVPDPQAHVLGNQPGLVRNLLVIHIGGDVDEARQLLVHTVVGRPYPLLVVVGAVHLDEGAVLGRNSVQVAIAILLVVLLVLVEILPRTLQLPQFRLGSKVASLPVAAQLLVPHKRTLLATSQFIDHQRDVLLQQRFLRLVRA